MRNFCLKIVEKQRESNPNQSRDFKMKTSLLASSCWCFYLLLVLFVGTTISSEIGTRVKKALQDDELLLEEEQSGVATTTSEQLSGEDQLTKLLEGASFFKKDALDLGELAGMDCHLRNLDFCYAGLMGTTQRALPETDDEFEVRCDEMKSTQACLAKFNERCQTFKIFSLIGPSVAGQMAPQQEKLSQMQIPPLIEQTLINNGDNKTKVDIKMSDLLEICEPKAKQTKANKRLRERLFKIAKCVNPRIPALRPCIEDLKVALQLFYEPRKSLPMKPSCCAMGRFRHCAKGALDNVCGLSSFDQLEETLSTSGGSGTNMLKLVERVCREGFKHNSTYCVEVLPPSGMKAPQRRGHKASKLARALDLISFAPAVQ